MNTRLLLLAATLAGLTSCSTAYRTGQTPDDVYYSPERQVDQYVVTNGNRDNGRRYNEDYGSNYYESRDDQYLRMMVRNRNRWSAFDNYYAMDSYFSPFSSYSYHMNPWANNFNPWSYSFYNNYYSWNSFYNPYCSNIVILNPIKNPTYYNKIKTFNLNAYNNNNYTNTNANRGKNFNRPGINPAYGAYGTPRYSNSNSNSNRGTSSGNSGRKVFGNNNSRQYEYNSASDRPVRSYTPSTSNERSSINSGNTNSGSSGSGRSSGGSSGGSTGGRPGRG